MTRWISLLLLLLHFYYACYGAFFAWGLHLEITDNLLRNVARTGLFHPFYKAKVAALLFLVISGLGARAKKVEGASYRKPAAYLLAGLLLYFTSRLILLFTDNLNALATAYMASRHRSPSAALVAAGAGWFGLSHLVAAGTGYPGCPELGAIPSLLARREVRVGCVPWRIVDNRLGLAR